MKNYTLLLLMLLGFNTSYAQMGYGKPEDIKEVQQKTLLVVLDAPNDKESKKLGKKKGDVETYEKEINDYNEALKEVFPKEWTTSKNVEFVTQEQFEAILNDKTKRTQYAYFNNVVNRSTFISNGVNEGGTARVPLTYSHSIGLTNQAKPVYSMMFNTLHPNKSDLIFIVQQFQNYFKMRLEDKARKDIFNDLISKSALLKDKTLLLDEDLVDKNLSQKMSEVYKFKYKITNKQEIDNAIATHDKGIAYVRLIPAAQMVDNVLIKSKSYDPPAASTSKMLYAQYVINAENGEGISYINGTGDKTTLSGIKELAKNIEGR